MLNNLTTNQFTYYGKPLRLDSFHLYQFRDENKELDLQEVIRTRHIIENNNFTLFNEKDIEGRLNINKIESIADTDIYLYCEITSTTEKLMSILCFRFQVDIKIWLNDQLIHISSRTSVNISNIDCKLKKGKNQFLVKIENHHPINSLISFRISDSSYENALYDNSYLSQNIFFKSQEKIIIVDNANDYLVDDIYKFSVLPNDLYIAQNISDIIVQIYQEKNPNTVKHFRLGLFESIETCLLDCVSTFSNEIIVKATCNFKDGTNQVIFKCFLIRQPLQYIENTIEAAKSSLESKDICDDFKIYIAEYLCNTLQTNRITDKYWNAKKLFAFMKGINSYKNYNEYLNLPGYKEVLFRSKLDNGIEKIHVSLPITFDSNKEYPLFLFNATHRYSYHSCYFAKSNDFDCIFADLSGRGVTGGSYIGEASIIEMINELVKVYKIDRRRIYMAGTSNGAYATWSLAQNHPGLFAGILTVSGQCFIQNIENVCNTKIINISSNLDRLYEKAYRIVNEQKTKLINYKPVFIKNMLHSELLCFLYKQNTIKDFLGYENNPYPDKITFRTERNRHLKSYWINLHGICKGSIYAKIKAKIIGDSKIEVTIIGGCGLTIQIPPQIVKTYFKIVINKQSFVFINYEFDTIRFSYDNNWDIETDNTEDIDYTKGTGLLDIYLDRFRIITPDIQSETVMNVASNFSKPHSNGFDSTVYVNYPIHKASNISNQIWNNNLLIIDVNGNNEFLQKFELNPLLKSDDTGFEYMNHRIEAEYVAMQVLPNPYNRLLSILVIKTNSEKLLARHILLRKVILPTYCCGINDYWNNNILVYTGGNYYAAYEKGGALKQIEAIKQKKAA